MKKTLIALLMGLMLAGCGAEKDAAVSEEKAVETSEEERFEVITVDGPKELTAEEIDEHFYATVEYGTALLEALDLNYRYAENESKREQLLLEFSDIPKATTRTRDAAYALGEEYKTTVEDTSDLFVVDYEVEDGRRLYITIDTDPEEIDENTAMCLLMMDHDTITDTAASSEEVVVSASKNLRQRAAQKGFDLDCLVRKKMGGVVMAAAHNGYIFYDIRDEEIESVYILDYKDYDLGGAVKKYLENESN